MNFPASQPASRPAPEAYFQWTLMDFTGFQLDFDGFQWISQPHTMEFVKCPSIDAIRLEFVAVNRFKKSQIPAECPVNFWGTSANPGYQ